MSERTGTWSDGCGCMFIAFMIAIALIGMVDQWYEYQQRQERVRACAQVGGWLDKSRECGPFAKAPEGK